MFNWYKKYRNLFTFKKYKYNCSFIYSFIYISDIYPNEVFDKLWLDLVNNIMCNFPRTKEGGTSLTDRNGVSLNEGYIWIDTLFMLNVFLNKI